MAVSRSEFVSAVRTIVARENAGEYVPDFWESLTENQVVGVASRPAETIFVNVYRLDRHCGGAEEGGWWFDEGTAELSIMTTIEHVDVIADMLREIYVDHGNRSSVIYYRKDADYSVSVEAHPAEDWSDYQPWE